MDIKTDTAAADARERRRAVMERVHELDGTAHKIEYLQMADESQREVDKAVQTNYTDMIEVAYLVVKIEIFAHALKLFNPDNPITPTDDAAEKFSAEEIARNRDDMFGAVLEELGKLLLRICGAKLDDVGDLVATPVLIKNEDGTTKPERSAYARCRALRNDMIVLMKDLAAVQVPSLKPLLPYKTPKERTIVFHIAERTRIIMAGLLAKRKPGDGGVALLRSVYPYPTSKAEKFHAKMEGKIITHYAEAYKEAIRLAALHFRVNQIMAGIKKNTPAAMKSKKFALAVAAFETVFSDFYTNEGEIGTSADMYRFMFHLEQIYAWTRATINQKLQKESGGHITRMRHIIPQDKMIMDTLMAEILLHNTAAINRDTLERRFSTQSSVQISMGMPPAVAPEDVLSGIHRAKEIAKKKKAMSAAAAKEGESKENE